MTYTPHPSPASLQSSASVRTAAETRLLWESVEPDRPLPPPTTRAQRNTLLHVLFSLYHAIKTAQLSYNDATGSQFQNESNTKLFACVKTQSQVLPPLIFLSFPLSPLSVRHTHAQTPTLQTQTRWLSHFLTLRSPHLEQSHPRHRAILSSFKRKINTRGS